MDSFRKAYGALKDSTKVGLARVNSEFKELDIAIVKATNHNECPPKERHVRKIFHAVSISSPRADVNYCIHALSKRLSKTSCWIVAMKTLIVYHRLLREADPSFREELTRYASRGQLFQVATFKDDSGALAFDCSACVRSYAFFLEERLECYRNFQFEVETERGSKNSSSRSIDSPNIRCDSPPTEAGILLTQLPALQQLLYRLVSCQPEGLARQNFVIQYALALVVKDSFKVYCAINDRIINLVDMYFEMPRDEAVRALNIYQKAGRQADHLSVFYEFCKTLDLARTFQFPTLTQPPPSFLSTMEDYIKEAPLTRAPRRRMEDQEKQEEPEKPEEPEEPIPEENEEQDEEDDKKEESVELQEQPASTTKQVDQQVNSVEEPVDFLGLDEEAPQASAIEETNALALAIIQPDDNPPLATNLLDDIGKISGWELALVETPSNMNKPQVVESKLAGGFDKSLLDSLYEDDVSRKQLQLHSAGYSTSFNSEITAPAPFDPHNPFAMSDTMNAAPNNMQMVPFMSQQDQQQIALHPQQHQQQIALHPQQQQQQQHMMMMQQQNMMMMMMAPNYPYSAQYSSQQQMPVGSTNPFADPFAFPQNTMPQNGQHTLF